jgi:hypothetical protein
MLLYTTEENAPVNGAVEFVVSHPNRKERGLDGAHELFGKSGVVFSSGSNLPWRGRVTG